jgi:L-alanine-DL-glutamate epimerase-like enolase superfamily enzyme
MADECCGDHHDAARLIDLGACDYFNIKLGKAGGIRNGVRIVRLAEAAGIKLQVGAMIESRLAMTAFAHFACCSPQIVHYDFDTALMFREDPVTGGIRYEKNGVIRLPEGPGLGATIDEQWLQRMEAIQLS